MFKKINEEIVMYSTLLVLSVVTLLIINKIYPLADQETQSFLMVSDGLFLGIILVQAINIVGWVRERL